MRLLVVVDFQGVFSEDNLIGYYNFLGTENIIAKPEFVFN